MAGSHLPPLFRAKGSFAQNYIILLKRLAFLFVFFVSLQYDSDQTKIMIATFREETARGRRLDAPSRLLVCRSPLNGPPLGHIPIISTHSPFLLNIISVFA